MSISLLHLASKIAQNQLTLNSEETGTCLTLPKHARRSLPHCLGNQWRGTPAAFAVLHAPLHLSGWPKGKLKLFISHVLSLPVPPPNPGKDLVICYSAKMRMQYSKISNLTPWTQRLRFHLLYSQLYVFVDRC